MAVAEAQRRAAEERLRYDTPFWAGGVTRDSRGRWQLPAPNAFQGCAKILNKRMELVPAIARPWQLELDEILEKQRAEGLPMRVIILKARQLGFSTWIVLKFLQRVTQLPNQSAVIVAQDVDTAGKILNMAKRAYSHLPTEEELGMGFPIKPRLVSESNSPNGRKNLMFGEPVRALRSEGRTDDSVFEIDTAGSPTAGRGGTRGMAHLSELAFYESEQATRKLQAVLESVPYQPETIVAMESTANGLNHFHKRWMSAVQGAADPDSGEAYVPIFVPWWRDPECAKPFATTEGRDRFMDTIGDQGKYGEIAEDEEMLIEMYACTPEQLFWRRMKIQEHPSKSVQGFNQENPHSPESAFIGSGRTVFPGVLIAKAIKATAEVPEPVRGVLRVAEQKERRSRSGSTLVPVSVAWTPAERAKPDEHVLEVWEHPRKADSAPLERDGQPTSDFERREGAYMLAVDVAGGEANTFSEGDYHVLSVFDWHTRMQVAVHVSRMDVHLMPLWVMCVALYYNEARVAVEVNGPGIGVVDPLSKELRYRRMYRRERLDDERLHVRSSKPGWETNMATKPAMEANFMALLDSDIRGGLRDPQTSRQLATYVVNERGKHLAAVGEYDDRLMAAMIAQMVMSMRRPPKIGGKRVEGFEPKDPVTGW